MAVVFLVTLDQQIHCTQSIVQNPDVKLTLQNQDMAKFSASAFFDVIAGACAVAKYNSGSLRTRRYNVGAELKHHLVTTGLFGICGAIP